MTEHSTKMRENVDVVPQQIFQNHIMDFLDDMLWLKGNKELYENSWIVKLVCELSENKWSGKLAINFDEGRVDAIRTEPVCDHLKNESCKIINEK